MTWGEFKKAVEELGVKDDDDIRYVDTSFWGPLCVAFEESKEGEPRRCTIE